MDVSQLLGLDTSTLDISNHEILKQLETYLHHHHHHLHHCDSRPLFCPAHQRSTSQNTHRLDSSLGLSTSRSHGLSDSAVLHEN